MGGSVTRRLMLGALVAGVTSSLLACGQRGRSELQQVQGKLSIEPAVVDFGEVTVGKESSQTVTVRNDGAAPVTVAIPEQLVQEGVVGHLGGKGEWLVSSLPITLESGDSITVSVSFHPASVGARDMALPLQTDSVSSPVVPMQLVGKGVLGQAQLSSESVDFGEVVIGEKGSQTLTLVNNDKAATEVTLAGISGPDAALFHADQLGTIALAAEQQVVIRIDFAPGSVGAFLATLLIKPCPSCEQRPIGLSGAGAIRVVELSPAQVDFGDVQAGTSAARGFTLSNKSKGAVDLTRLTAAGQGPVQIVFDGNLTVPLTLAAGQQLNGTAIFKPDGFGARAGTVSFTASDGAAPVLSFQGFGFGPMLAVTPAKLVDVAAILSTTRSETITITNTGLDPKNALPLTIASATITGPGAADWKVTTPALPWIVGAPGTSADFEVSFSPSGVGVSSATLVLESNDQLHRSLQVSLDGLGRDLPPCQLHVAPGVPVEFGLVPVGQPSTMGFELVNDGSDDCIFGDPKIVSGGPAFRWPGGTAPTGRQLPAHGRMSVRVQLAAAQAAEYSGEVRMYLSDPAAPSLSVPLHGQGDSGCFIVAPGALDYGGVEMGCGVPAQSAFAHNWCGQAVTITALDVPAPFLLGPNAPTLPAVIQPNGVLEIPITYRAGSAGDDVAALSVTASVNARPFQVGLTGGSIAEQVKTDAWDQSTPKVDLLFVVDNSGSMQEEQQALQANLDVLWSRIALANADFHIAVTTTGMTPYTSGWSQCPGGAQGGEAGRFFPVDGSRPRILTPQTPDVKNALFQNLDVGLCHWDERFTDPVIAALSPPLTTSNAADSNAGFLRDDARLGLIALSDTDDSGDEVNPTPIANLVDALKTAKHGALDLVSFGGIVPFTACSTAESPGVRYQQIAQALNGHLEDICDLPHMGARLNGVLDRILLPLTSFTLSARPRDPSAISVTVNGKATAAFTYDAGSNRIVFAPADAPAPGSHIEATYQLACN